MKPALTTPPRHQRDLDDGRIDGWARRRLPLERRVRVALSGILIARVAVNGALRVVYPFLAVIAAGLGVSLQTIALLVATRSLAGLGAPLFARWATPARWYPMMLTALAMIAAGAAAILLAGEITHPARMVILTIGFAATGIARPLFELPMQAWLTTRVPHAQRGRAVGLAELGWALSLAVTVPAAGLLIGFGGWRYAFVVVLGCCGLGVVAVRTLIAPAIKETFAGSHIANRSVRSVAFDRPVAARPARSAVVLCVAMALSVTAGEMLLVTHGSWMSKTFGLSTGKIGVITVVIVLAELTGCGLVAAIADRLGPGRTLHGALLASAFTALLLGRADDVATAIFVIGIWFVTFEAIIVTLIALATTIGAPGRAEPRVLGWMMAAMASGNAIGAAIAPILFVDGDIAGTGAMAAALSLSAAAVLALGTPKVRRLKPVLSAVEGNPNPLALDPRPHSRQSLQAPPTSPRVSLRSSRR